MDYPVEYRSQTLNAIQSIDLAKVSQAIQIFKSARTHGRRIFVCGSGGTDSMVPQHLCDIVNSVSFDRSSRFRILALSDQMPRIGSAREDFSKERIFVEQLKNFAEPADVVMGICASGDSPSIASAIEYASWIGCRTIVLVGNDGGEAVRLAELAIEIPAGRLGSVEDAHLMICHMIGYYFVESENASKKGA